MFRKRIRQLSSRAAYARWAAHYPPEAHNPFMALEQATLLAILPDLAGKSVLDLACGSGRWGKIAAERGAGQVISLDDSLPMLQRGQPPKAIGAAMTALPVPSAWVDVIICGLAIGHVPRDDFWQALAEMSRVLRPGGVALISDLHPVRAWLGAQRTFRVGSQTYAIAHDVHSLADYVSACRSLALTVHDAREGRLMDDEPPHVLAVVLASTSA